MTKMSASVVAHPHSAEASRVAQSLGVNSQQGLTDAEIAARVEQYGVNVIQAAHSRPAWRLLLNQFASLIIALLGVAALVSWLTGDRVESTAILVVLVVNALVGFVTEWQANRALDALRRQAKTVARVRRGGQESEINAGELVPGDIVVLNPGDRVPADARIIEAINLRTEESALTGESTTIEKSAAPVATDALLAERTSMLYLGTSIAAGRTVAVITAIGTNTELGKIGKLVAASPEESTPLKRKLEELGRRLVYLVLAIGAVVMVAGWLRGNEFWLMVEVGISLAVAAVPEGLPAVTTLVLAIGMLRMAREHALVRRLHAVETLGSTTVICTDKTGTLTENRMTVREYRLADGCVVTLEEQAAAQPALQNNQLLLLAVRAGVLCNEASVSTDETGETNAIGDPTETALLTVAARVGMNVAQERSSYPKLAEHPFDSATRRMITLHKMPDGGKLALLKGAPSTVLAICSRYAASAIETHPLDNETRKQFLADNESMATEALRVLALAEKQIGKDEADALEQDYTFLGFVGMIDPPRHHVAESIVLARAAGIRVVMLTGDQVNTAHAIARELRLNGDDEIQVLHARDLENTDHAQLAGLAQKAHVFARVSPEDKLRIVEALQLAGEIVAVTGDGVNDAPALKRADIGVAMGLRGTETAKEAAAVVLTDDNFATILRAVEGGRTIYSNIVKFVQMLLSENLAEVFVIFTAIIIGWPLPLLPLQILWVNLVTDVFPALALALERSAPDVMQRAPRSPKESLLSRSFLGLVLWQGALLGAITLASYYWALNTYGDGKHTHTIALFSLVGVQVGHLFNCRSRTRSAFAGLLHAPFIWMAVATVAALQFFAVYFAPLARVLGTVELTKTDFGVIAISVLLPIVVVELVKLGARLTPHEDSQGG